MKNRAGQKMSDLVSFPFLVYNLEQTTGVNENESRI